MFLLQFFHAASSFVYARPKAIIPNPTGNLWTALIIGAVGSLCPARNGSITFSFPVTNPKLITAMLVRIHAKKVR
jgi:hypothetical protein